MSVGTLLRIRFLEQPTVPRAATSKTREGFNSSLPCFSGLAWNPFPAALGPFSCLAPSTTPAPGLSIPASLAVAGMLQPLRTAKWPSKTPDAFQGHLWRFPGRAGTASNPVLAHFFRQRVTIIGPLVWEGGRAAGHDKKRRGGPGQSGLPAWFAATSFFGDKHEPAPYSSAVGRDGTGLNHSANVQSPFGPGRWASQRHASWGYAASHLPSAHRVTYSHASAGHASAGPAVSPLPSSPRLAALQAPVGPASSPQHLATPLGVTLAGPPHATRYHW